MVDSSVTTPLKFIGIDVSQSSWDVHLLPEGRSISVRVSEGAVERLLKQLPSPEVCLIALEAAGGVERALVAALHDPGWMFAVVYPRPRRLNNCSPRPKSSEACRSSWPKSPAATPTRSAN